MPRGGLVGVSALLTIFFNKHELSRRCTFVALRMQHSFPVTSALMSHEKLKEIICQSCDDEYVVILM